MAILDLVQHPDEQGGEIIHRYPEQGSGEFRLGSQLVVRESQVAVFMRDGKALDVFGPGRHTLTTFNIPLLTGLIGLPFGGTSPFTAEVFFVSMREFLDMKWGTPQPITFRDSEFGMIRLRAHGSYSIRVADPNQLIAQIAGAQQIYTTAAVEDFLRNVIINEFTDILGAAKTSLLDLPGTTRMLADTARNALSDDFARIGLNLMSFQIISITPPEEVQKRIDERSGMAAVGNMDQYMQFKTAQAIGDAANNPGGEGSAATGVGLGAGIGLGQVMAQTMRDANAPAPPAAAPAAASAGVATMTCPKCQATIAAHSRFCPNCGQNLAPQPAVCPKCNAQNAPGAKFCSDCGNPLV